MNQNQPPKSNPWALRLMGLMAENLYLRSTELDCAYRQCLSLLMGEMAQSKRGQLRLVSMNHTQQPKGGKQHGA